MKCIIIFTLLSFSALHLFVCSLHIKFPFGCLHNWNAERSGNDFFFFTFIHDHWPYKMQLVGSDYILAKLISFLLLTFQWAFIISIHLKLSFQTLELESKKINHGLPAKCAIHFDFRNTNEPSRAQL